MKRVYMRNLRAYCDVKRKKQVQILVFNFNFIFVDKDYALTCLN